MNIKPIVVIDSSRIDDFEDLLFRDQSTNVPHPNYSRGRAIAGVIAASGHPVYLLVDSTENRFPEDPPVGPGITLLSLDLNDTNGEAFERRKGVAAAVAEAELLVAHMGVNDALLDSVIGMAQRERTRVFLWFNPCRRTNVRLSEHIRPVATMENTGNYRNNKMADYLLVDQEGAGRILGKDVPDTVEDSLAALNSLAVKSDYKAIVLTMGKDGIITYERGFDYPIVKHVPCSSRSPDIFLYHRASRPETYDFNSDLVIEFVGGLAVGLCGGHVDAELIAELTYVKTEHRPKFTYMRQENRKGKV